MFRKMLFALAALSIVASFLIAANKPAGSNFSASPDGKKNPTLGFYAFPGGGPSWVSVPLGPGFAQIQRLSLPPGNYIANASAVLSSNNPGVYMVDCIFTLGGNLEGELARGVIGGTFNNFLTLTLTAGFTTETTQDLAVACRSDSSGVVWSQGSPITAISVDGLTIQGGFQP